jgi:hypothetical protein
MSQSDNASGRKATLVFTKKGKPASLASSDSISVKGIEKGIARLSSQEKESSSSMSTPQVGKTTTSVVTESKDAGSATKEDDEELEDSEEDENDSDYVETSHVKVTKSMFFEKCGELVRAEKQLEAFRKEKAESQSSSSSDAQPKPNTTTYVVGRDAVSITGATLNYTSAKRFHDYLDREYLNNRAVDRLALMDFSARKMLEGKFLLAGKIDEDNRDAWLG